MRQIITMRLSRARKKTRSALSASSEGSGIPIEIGFSHSGLEGAMRAPNCLSCIFNLLNQCVISYGFLGIRKTRISLLAAPSRLPARFVHRSEQIAVKGRPRSEHQGIGHASVHIPPMLISQWSITTTTYLSSSKTFR